MKVFLFITFFVINSSCVFCQNLKTYHGSYEANVVGIADYQYYENENFERIYNGNFSFSGTENHAIMNFLFTEGYKTTYNIIGHFKNNLKDGIWDSKIITPKGAKIKILTYESESSPGNTEHIYGKYANGYKIGEWVYSIAAGNSSIVGISTVHFKENTLTGNFDYNTPDLKVSGKFDINGYMDGDWKIAYKDYDRIEYKDERKYKNGVLYWRLYRKMSTGEIIAKFDNTTTVFPFFANYNVDSSITIVNDEPYTLVDEVFYNSESENEGKLESDIRFESAIRFWINPNSDNNMFELNIGVKDMGSITISRKIVVDWRKFQELKDEQEKQNQKLKTEREKEEQYQTFVTTADAAFRNKKYYEAIYNYKEALNINNAQYPSDRIKEAESLQKEIDYQNIIAEADTAFNNRKYKEAISKYQFALKEKDNQYPKHRIEEAEIKMADIEKKYSDEKKNADNLFNTKQYSLAILAYEKALSFKDEEYPKTQIEAAKQIIAFLKERIYKYYSIKEINKPLYDELNKTLQCFIIDNLKEKVPADYYFEGNLIVIIDTLGKISTNLVLSDKKEKIKKEIKNFINNVHFPVQVIKGYNVNSKLEIPIKIKTLVGFAKYTIYNNDIQFSGNEPDQYMSIYLRDKYKHVTTGPFHEDKYEYIIVNDSMYVKEQLK